MTPGRAAERPAPRFARRRPPSEPGSRHTVWIGTSGWQYGSWKKRFYPADLPAPSWLEFFAQRFPTVEINNSFYMLPQPHVFERWRERTPPGFVFAVKGNRFITHVRRLKDPGETVATFWERAVLLGDTLGPVLWQLPPTFKADPPRLRAFLDALPRQMLPALEFRHPSWESDRVRSMLDDAGAAFVLPDRPGWRIAPVVTGGWSYIRFHEGRRGAPGYTAAKLRRWADRIAALPSRETWVYFNNDPEGAALRDAARMTALLEERGLEVRGRADAARRKAG